MSSLTVNCYSLCFDQRLQLSTDYSSYTAQSTVEGSALNVQNHQYRIILFPKADELFGSLRLHCDLRSVVSARDQLGPYQRSQTSLHTPKTAEMALVHPQDSSYLLNLTKIKQPTKGFISWKIPVKYLKDHELGFRALNNEIIIRVTFSYVNETYDITQSLPKRRVLVEDFWNHLCSKSLCDVKLNVGGELLSAHVMVLSARSDVFKAMFEHELLETHTKMVNIDNFRRPVIEAMLQFFYTDSIELRKMATQDMLDLTDVALFYQSTGLLDYCEEQLCKCITDHTAFTFAAFAEQRDLPLLKAATVFYFTNNGHDLAGKMARQAHARRLIPEDIAASGVSKELQVDVESRCSVTP